MNKQFDVRTQEVLSAIKQRRSKSFDARAKAETIIDRYIAEEVPRARAMLFRQFGSTMAMMGIAPGDVEQAARIGIWRALVSYNDKKDMALDDLVHSRCEQAFISHVREDGLPRGHIHIDDPISIDDGRETVHSEIPSTAFKSPEDSVAAAILDEKVFAAVRQLPQPLKEPLIMYFYWHCTAGKIGEIMGYGRNRASLVLQEACLEAGKALVKMKVANAADLPKSKHEKFLRKNLGRFNSP